MFVGFKKQYDWIHLETSERRKIFGTGRSKKAIALRVIHKEVLLVQDTKGYFVDYEATPTRSKCIEWSDIPIAIAYFHPYIVSVLPETVEIHHLSTLCMIHQIHFQHGQFTESVSYKSSSIWTSRLCVASSNDIIVLSQSLIAEQLKFLLKENVYIQSRGEI